MQLTPGSMLPARWNTEQAENWDFLPCVFPLRAGPEIFLTQETPENQALQRERELEKASAALAILCLLTKKAQKSGLRNGNGNWHGTGWQLNMVL